MSDELFERVAAELDEFESVSEEVVADVVRDNGLCGWIGTTGDMPEWSGNDRMDRELVAPICAGCPVQRECLEWEFRTAGYATAGVWGPLDAEDRRAVFLRLLDRRDDRRTGGRS